MLIGLLTAMVSVGMALVYRANRILNFAQADLGYIPASLSVMIVITSGLPWLVAFGAGFAAAVALGAACELLIIRRFFRAPRLVLTVATLGLTQLLAFGGLFLPRAFGEKVRSQRIDPPFDFTFHVDPLVFNANDLLVLIDRADRDPGDRALPAAHLGRRGHPSGRRPRPTAPACSVCR